MEIDFDKIARFGAAGLANTTEDPQTAFSRGFYGSEGPPPGTYRKQEDLRALAAMTPEEEADNLAYETSDAVRAEFEQAIKDERDPKKRAILEEAYAKDFGTAPMDPAIGITQTSLSDTGAQPGAKTGRAEAKARELIAEREALLAQARQRAAAAKTDVSDHQPTPFQPMTDVSGELERQAAADEAPMTTSLKRGWRQMTDAAANFSDVMAGNDAAVAKRIAEGAEYDYLNPMPSSAQKWKHDWEASNTIGWMTNLSGFIQNNLEQLANSAPAMVGAIPGSIGGAAAGAAIGGPAAPVTALIGGIIGGTIGSAPGSIAIEGGARITEMMARDKVDLGNPVAVQSWLKANRDNIIREGVIKGTTTAAFDGLMGGIGTRIVAGPYLAFQAASAKTLQSMGVDMSNRAAVSAAMKAPAYKAAMAAPAREFQEATKTAANAMRGTASFAGEMFGEGGGEYFGEVFATGKGNLDEALLEALMAGGQSAITTAAEFAGRRFVGGAADREFKAHVDQLAAYQPKPNSPLSNAAAAGGALPGATTTPPPPPGGPAGGAPGGQQASGWGGYSQIVPFGDPELDAIQREIGAYLSDWNNESRLKNLGGQDLLGQVRDLWVNAVNNPEFQATLRVNALNQLRDIVRELRDSTVQFTTPPGGQGGQGAPESAGQVATITPQSTAVGPANREIYMGDAQVVTDRQALPRVALPRQMLDGPSDAQPGPASQFAEMPDDVLQSTRARVVKDIEKSVSGSGQMSAVQAETLKGLDREIANRKAPPAVSEPSPAPVVQERPLEPAAKPVATAEPPAAAPAKKAAANVELVAEDIGGGGVRIAAYPAEGGKQIGLITVPGSGVTPTGFKASDLYVGAPARRSGIGTALADKAEEVLGVPLVGFSGQATAESKAFLEARKAPRSAAPQAQVKPAAEAKAAAPTATPTPQPKAAPQAQPVAPAAAAEAVEPPRTAGVSIDDVPPKLLKKLPVPIDRLVGDDVETVMVPAAEALAEIDEEIAAYRKLLACVRASA